MLAPAITAGEIVTAARAAGAGWDNPAVSVRFRSLGRQRSCDVSAPRCVLEAAGVEYIAAFVELHP